MSINKSHARNKDKFLDRNGENEISAEEIKNFIEVEANPVLTADIKLLLPFDEGNGVSTIDKSLNPHVISFAGNTNITTAQKQFGESSALFDGAGDRLTLVADSDWDLINQTNFTIAMWVKHNSTNTIDCYMQGIVDTDNFWRVCNAPGGNGLRIAVKKGPVFNVGSGIFNDGIPDLEWHHVAFIKTPSGYGVYLDGSQVGFAAIASAPVSANYVLSIGSDISNNDMDGYIDEVIVTHDNFFGMTPAAPNVGGGTSFIPPTKQFFPDVQLTNTIVSSDGDRIYQTQNTAQDLEDVVVKQHVQNSDIKLDDGQANEVSSVEIRNILDRSIVTIGSEETANFTATKNALTPVDVTTMPITATPPSSPVTGDTFVIVDSRFNAFTNNITVDFTTATQNLYGSLNNWIINEDGGYVQFIYINTSIGWIAHK